MSYADELENAKQDTTHEHFCPQCREFYDCPRPQICSADDGEILVCVQCDPDEVEMVQ